MPTAFPFRHRLEVRFRDCDAMGHVNNAVYLTYLEQARFAMWRDVSGLVFERASGFILARVEIDYRAPALAGDELEVGIGVDEVRRSSFVLGYEVVNAATGQLVAHARTVLVTYDYTANRSIPVPEPTRTVLEHLKSSSFNLK